MHHPPHFLPSKSFQDSSTHFYHLVATELNNLGAVLYDHGEYPSALQLYKLGVEKMICLEEGSPLADREMLLDQIAQVKEKIRVTTTNSSSSQIAKGRLDLYGTTFRDGSTHDHGPQPIQESFLLPSRSTEQHAALDQHQHQHQHQRKADENTAIIIYNMGLIHHINGSEDVALKLYDTARFVMSEEPSSHCRMLLALYNNKGQISYTLGQLRVALDHFDEALRIGRQAKLQAMDDDERKQINRYLGIILSNMGRVYFVKGQYDEALDKCQEAFIEWRFARLGTDDLNVVAILYNMGLISHRKGDMGEALKMYRNFLDHVMTICSSDDIPSSFHDAEIDLAVSLHHIGQTLETLGMLTEAMECFNQALLLGAGFITSHTIFAVILCHIGMIYFRANNYNKSLQLLEYSLHLLRSFPASHNSSDVADILHSIGIAHIKNGKITEAMKSFTESSSMCRLLFGNSDYRVAKSLYQIGQLFQEIGDYTKAMDAFQETIRIQKMALGEFHPSIAVTLYSISEIHYFRGDLDLSLKVCNHVLSIAMIGDDDDSKSSILVANVLSMIGNIHLETRSVSNAMVCFIEASSIYENAAEQANSEHSHMIDAGHIYLATALENLPSAAAA